MAAVTSSRPAVTRPAVSPPIIDRESAELLAERFSLLADPTRLLLLSTLITNGDMRVGNLAAAVGVSESATSHQLRQMRLAGLVRAIRVGREAFYRIADSHVTVLVESAAAHYLGER